MPSSHTLIPDVLVAGAGPVGLFLACELRLAGCSVQVLEKAASPASPLKGPPFGLRGLTVPTVESLDRRGLLRALRARAVGRQTPGAHWMQQQRKAAGHFAGIPFFYDQIDLGDERSRVEAFAPFAVDIAGIEAVLTARAEDLGVAIRRGAEVQAITSLEDHVVVTAGDETFCAHWLVGCDGARSAVRKAARIEFVGTEPEFTGYSVQVELSDPQALEPGRRYTAAGMYTCSAPGTVAMVDFDGGAVHRSGAVTREDVEAVLRKISGVELSVRKVDLATTWTDRAFQAVDYRHGRVLLAGDAAHIHSPLGGQGLNLGLGDAMNLGWKLAATILGGAPDNLLDSYAAERAPVAAEILDWSRAQVALMRPARSSRALEGIIRDLVETPDGATYFAGRVWGLRQHYDVGQAHPLTGRSAPDFQLADGTRSNARLRDGRGLLLDFAARPSTAELAGRWGGRVGYVQGDPGACADLDAVLVRPDGIVAWVDAEGAEGDLCGSLTTWFGRPDPAPANSA